MQSYKKCIVSREFPWEFPKYFKSKQCFGKPKRSSADFASNIKRTQAN